MWRRHTRFCNAKIKHWVWTTARNFGPNILKCFKKKKKKKNYVLIIFHWICFWIICKNGKSVLVQEIQYIPRNMHTVFTLLCFVVVIHWLIFPYPSGLLHWHCGNLTIAPVPAKQPWWIWINTSCEFIMNDCITTTKQNTTKPCAYFLGYTVVGTQQAPSHYLSQWWPSLPTCIYVTSP